MGKASRPGNQAVAGITGTSTTSPTFTREEAIAGAANTKSSSQSGAGSSANKGSSNSKSSTSTSVKNTYSNTHKDYIFDSDFLCFRNSKYENTKIYSCKRPEQPFINRN